jgi:hypothetical protein
VSAGEVIEERDGYRVCLKIEEGPEEPYYDGQSPLLRIDPRTRKAEHIQIGSMRPTDDDTRIEEAVSHWATTPADSDWKLFEKYLRAYYGVTRIVTYWSDTYWYVTYDSAAWREAAGAPEGSANLDEYRAWVEGEVYYYIIEKRVTWRAVNPVTDDPEYSEYPERTTWETVDSCGGYYGDEYAEQEARRAFGEFMENRD